MIRIKAAFYLIMLPAMVLFASDESDSVPDTAQHNDTEIDSANVTSEAADSGKTDSTVADSVLAVVIAKKAQEEARKVTLPELEIVSSRFVEFLDHSFSLQGEELVFDGSFIVKGKAVYGHFDFMMIGDSGAVITVVCTDDRSYRRDRGGRLKTITMKTRAAAGCTLVKAYFHEMRIEPEKGFCTRGKSKE
jgi:hypothetical protein